MIPNALKVECWISDNVKICKTKEENLLVISINQKDGRNMMIIPKCNDTQSLLNFCSGIDKQIFKKDEQLEEVLSANKKNIIDLFFTTPVEGQNQDSIGQAERFKITERESEQIQSLSMISSWIQEESISVPNKFRVKSTFIEAKCNQIGIQKIPIQLSRKYLEFNSDIDVKAVKLGGKILLCISFYLKDIYRHGEFLIIDSEMDTQFDDEKAENSLSDCFTNLRDLAYFNTSNAIEMNFEAALNAIGDKALVGLVLNRDRTQMFEYMKSQ